MARLLVSRLVRAGHRRLCYARPHDERLAEPTAGRREALRRACAAKGLPEPDGGAR